MALFHSSTIGLCNCLSASSTGRTCPASCLPSGSALPLRGGKLRRGASNGSNVHQEMASRASVRGMVAAFPSLLACGEAAAGGSEHVHSNASDNGAIATILRGLLLAELDPDMAQLLIHILGPVFTSLNLLFILRIVMSWYPALPVGRFPFVIAYAPTEPVLEPTRRLFRPVGGVDISPIIWVAVISFFNEILLGQQGLLVLLSQERV